MTVPTNAEQTYGQVNIREDMIDTIFNVTPYETPLLTLIKKTKAKQTYHEWNTDALAAQNLSNAAVEGDDATALALTPTTRLGNYTQISTKVVTVSGTSQQVVAAGGSLKMGYQIAKKAKELKIDMEGILTSNTARSAGSASTARLMGGLPCYLGTNTVFQTGGTPSGANPAALTGADTRTYNSVKAAVTEANIKQVVLDTYKSSGHVPTTFVMSPANKQIVSSFTGPGTRFTEVEDKVLKVTIDYYDSDFGRIKMVPDIYLATSGDIYAIDPQYLRLAFLRPFFTKPLADTGDSTKKMMIVEYTLEVGNEKALGAIYDTTG